MSLPSNNNMSYFDVDEEALMGDINSQQLEAAASSSSSSFAPPTAATSSYFSSPSDSQQGGQCAGGGAPTASSASWQQGDEDYSFDEHPSDDDPFSSSFYVGGGDYQSHASLAVDPIVRGSSGPQPEHQQQQPSTFYNPASAASSSSCYPMSSNQFMSYGSIDKSRRGGADADRGGTRGGGRGDRGGNSSGASSSSLWQQKSQWSGTSATTGREPRRGGTGRGRGKGRGREGSNAYESSNSVYSQAPSQASYTFIQPSADEMEAMAGPDLEFGDEEGKSFEPEPESMAEEASFGRDGVARPIYRPGTIDITVLPAPFRCIFQFGRFNLVQSKCFPPTFLDGDNLVISAPTGSGKTAIFELAILRFFHQDLLTRQGSEYQVAPKQQKLLDEEQQRRRERDAGRIQDGEDEKQGGDGEDTMKSESVDLDQAGPSLLQRPTKNKWSWKKAVYIAPLRALCEQRASDWQKFALHLGLKVLQVTGDKEASPWDLKAAHIIITTPEKWDALSRRLQHEDMKLMQSVGLMMVDEIHLLNDETRGATLEGLLSRLKMRQIEASRNIQDPARRPWIGNLRIVVASATCHNSEDLAEWLHAHDYTFDASHRPVPLDYACYDYSSRNGNPYVFENALNSHLLELVVKHSEGKPTLIFNATRKGCEQAAKAITDQIQKNGLRLKFIKSELQHQRLMNTNLPESMRTYLDFGVAFHHAGLSNTDRSTIERLFMASDILVLCSTTTLGQGLNLPARCVIVKGTTGWDDRTKSFRELEETVVTQMLGRAGRPGYDKKGAGVVMTNSTTAEKYRRLIGGKSIESRLQDALVDHINAEVVHGSIDSVESCDEWLKSTFMFTRMRRNPRLYFGGQYRTDAQITYEVTEMAKKAITDLRDVQLIEFPDENRFRSTELGQLISRWYLSFETAKLIQKIGPQTVFEDFLDLISNASELVNAVRLKVGDKGQLKPFLVRRRRKKVKSAAAAVPLGYIAATVEEEMMLRSQQQSLVVEEYEPPMLRYPIEGGKINTVVRAEGMGADKIKVLIQVKCQGIHDQPGIKANMYLQNDMNESLSAASRVVRAMEEYIRSKCDMAMQRAYTFEHVQQPPEDMTCGFLSLVHILQFRKSMTNQVFADSSMIFAQFPGVGPATAAKLYSQIKSLDALSMTHASRVNALAGRRDDFGEKLVGHVRKLRFYNIEIVQDGFLCDRAVAQVTIHFNGIIDPNVRNPVSSQVHLILGSQRNELLFYRKVASTDLPVKMKIDLPMKTHCKAFMIDDVTVGCDVDSVMFIRYGEQECQTMTPDSEAFQTQQALVEEAFAAHEISERKGRESHAAPVATDADDVESDEVTQLQRETQSRQQPQNQQASQESEGFFNPGTLSKKPHCKHKPPKCVTGLCKHACCHDRARDLQGTVKTEPAHHQAARSLFDDYVTGEKQEGQISPDDDFLQDDEPQTASSSRKRMRSFAGDDGGDEEKSTRSVSTTVTSSITPLLRTEDAFSHQLAQEMHAVPEGGSLVSNKRIRLQPPRAQPSPEALAAVRSNPTGYFDQPRASMSSSTSHYFVQSTSRAPAAPTNCGSRYHAQQPQQQQSYQLPATPQHSLFHIPASAVSNRWADFNDDDEERPSFNVVNAPIINTPRRVKRYTGY